MQLDENAVAVAAASTRAGTFSAFTMDEHRDICRAAITAYLQALSPGSTGETEGRVLVPKEPTEEQIEAMADAYRTTRRPGVCGMTIDAQFRAEFAPWFAAYRAMLSAAGER